MSHKHARLVLRLLRDKWVDEVTSHIAIAMEFTPQQLNVISVHSSRDGMLERTSSMPTLADGPRVCLAMNHARSINARLLPKVAMRHFVQRHRHAAIIRHHFTSFSSIRSRKHWLSSASSSISIRLREQTYGDHLLTPCRRCPQTKLQCLPGTGQGLEGSAASWISARGTTVRRKLIRPPD